MKEEKDLDLIEENLLFKDFIFKKNKFLNLGENSNVKPEITLLRNLQNEICNQILQNPKYIYLIFYYIEDYHKHKTTLAIKSLFKGFFSFHIINPVSLHRGDDIERLDNYFKKLNTHFKTYNDVLLNLTLVENNSIGCESNLFDNTLLIYLLNPNNYFSNHGINLFIHSYEPHTFLNYLKKNFFHLYQDFLKLLFIFLSKELYFEDNEYPVIDFQIKKNESSKKDYEDENVVIIDSAKIQSLYSVKEGDIKGKGKEGGDDEDEEEEEIIIIEENENGSKGEDEIKIIEEEFDEEQDRAITIPENEQEMKIDDELLIIDERHEKGVMEIQEVEENNPSKIINNIFKILKESNEIFMTMTVEYKNLYLYSTFIKDFRFIKITKRNAISLFLDLDENYFNDIEVNDENKQCPIDFLLHWLKIFFGMSFEYHYDTSNLEYNIDDSFLKNNYGTILEYFKSNNKHKKRSKKKKSNLLDTELEIDEEQGLLLKIHCIALFMKDILNESREYPRSSKVIQKRSLCHRHRYRIYDEIEDIMLSNFSLSNSNNVEIGKFNDQIDIQLVDQKEKLDSYKSIDEIIKKLKEMDSLIDVDELKTFSLSSDVINFIEENISPFLSLELRNNHQSYRPYQDFVKKILHLKNMYQKNYYIFSRFGYFV
ncbi:hypothetical protein PIROE2DRAFT_64614 [Piromyces sp. E2]|nr:hypothetical protein PIROE2DRAFT_64614 [Piromyces sp. E2]|eukprot:OUM58119.1 hypothetical protein PIROE2DRAFT_64614 [Piromyces sp. E2]